MSCQIPDRTERAAVLEAVRGYVRQERLSAPLEEKDLLSHARCIARDEESVAYTALEIHNEVWRPAFAQVPYERRLLLLPQCLSDSSMCRAEKDDLGLLCKRCGACSIGRILSEADKLGYVSLVAEGITVVRSLLESGKVDAVLGIGCLDSLMKVFPLMNRKAIPGIGLSLLNDGCRDTAIEETRVLESLKIFDPAKPGAWISDTLTSAVAQWFSPESLEALIESDADAARISAEWLRTGGKRWRPLLTAAVYTAAGGVDTAAVREAAVGVECFHKASLIHDDIEDGDTTRYDRPTVHVQHGFARAINAGDFLIGEGYRLLLKNAFSAEQKIRMIDAAARGHRALCLGQGEELAFCRQPSPVSESTVLRIYERKTAAAFEVAVLTGAIAAGIDAVECERLSAFSRAIGTAYQIADDMDDFDSAEGRGADGLMMKPTLFLSAACVSEIPQVRAALAAAWNGGNAEREKLAAAIRDNGLGRRVEQLYSYYRHETERTLLAVTHSGIQELLRRMTLKILPKRGDS